MSYTVKTLILSFIIVVLTYLFVLSVDPYDKEGIDLWDVGSKAVTSAREMKFTHLDSGRNLYKAFIIGSSRVLRMDPRVVEKHTGLRTFNYGVENANAEDLLAETMHLIDRQKPEMIVLFVDLYMMNGYIGADRRLAQSRLSKYLNQKSLDESEVSGIPYFHRSYLTMRALKDSLDLFIFRNEKRGDSMYLANGQHVIEEPVEEPRLATEYFENQYKDFRKDGERLEMFGRIKSLCQKNGIKLVAGQTPMNEEHLKKVLADPRLREMFITYKRELVRIFGGFHDFNNFSVSAYNEKKYWYDSVHPSENLTPLMINRMFDRENEENPGFGIYVTAANLDEYLRQF